MILKILVVDDSKMTRRVTAGLIGSRWTVCGEASDGRSGISEFRRLKPDLVLVDLAMPDIDGIEVSRQMHAIDPSVPLILFTLMDAWALQSAARAAGISRIVSKSEGWELVKAIEEVAAELKARSNKLKRSASRQRSTNPKLSDARSSH
ncbi:MAG: response regulator transcription factor [Acidobacteria bacterium]|nr:response regulator transcription factor [Acidobacteriota bacterium]